MNQAEITEQLIKYSQVKGYIELSDFLINETRKGLCFGYTLSHAAYTHSGKKEWWEAVIRKILDWNGSLETLEKITPPLPQQEREHTLNFLFRSALESVLFHQGMIIKFHPTLKNHSQDQLLEVGGGLEIGTATGIEKIKHAGAASGTFTERQIFHLLEEKRLDGKITIISNVSHSIHLYLEKRKWVIYNPNYNHAPDKKEECISKSFATKEEAIIEMTNILGYHLHIKTLSFADAEPVLFPYYDILVKNNAHQLIEEGGLSVLAFEPDLFKLVFQSLHDLPPKKMLSALSFTDPISKIAGVTLIGNYVPQFLPPILDILKKEPDGLQKFCLILAKPQLDNSFVFHQMISTHLRFFTHLLQLINDNQIEKIDELSDVLRIMNSHLDGLDLKRTMNILFEVFRNCAYLSTPHPHLKKTFGILAKLIQLISTQKYTDLINFVTYRDEKNKFILSLLSAHAPRALIDLCNIIKEQNRPFDLAFGITQKNKNALCLHDLIDNSPEILPDIFKVLTDTSTIPLIVRALMFARKKDGLLFQALINKAPTALPTLLDLFSKKPDELFKLLMKKNSMDTTFFYSILQSEPKLLNKIIGIFGIENSDKLASLFLSKDNIATDILQLAQIHTPSLLTKIFTILSSKISAAEIETLKRKYTAGHRIIISNLSSFTEINNVDYAVLIKKLKGLCFGLSLCHGAMVLSGKKDWWEAALVEVASWQNYWDELEENTPLPQQDQLKTLEEIFDQVSNFLLFHQAFSYEFFAGVVPHMNLMEKNGLFEFKAPNNEIKKIEHFNVAAGKFTDMQIFNLLDEKIMQGKLTMVLNLTHAINIGFEEKLGWYCYDSNYHHFVDYKKGESITKSFSSKIKLADEIQAILGNTLSFQTISFDEKSCVPNPYYDYLIENQPLKLLEEGGLSVIANQPTLLRRILNSAQQLPELPSTLLKEFLWADNTFQISGAYCVAHYLPEAVDLIKIMMLAEKGADKKIIQALTLTNELNHKSALDLLIENNPIFLQQWIDVINNPNYIHDSHSESKREKLITNPLYLFTRLPSNVSVNLSSLIKATAKQPNGSALLLEFMTFVNDDGFSGLQMVARRNSSLLPLFLKAVKSEKNGLIQLGEALTYNKNGLSGFKAIVEYAPNYLGPICNLLKRKHKSKLCEALKMKSLDGISGFHTIVQFAPNFLHQIPKILGYLFVIQLLGKQEWATGPCTLDAIVNYAPKFLYSLLREIENSSNSIDGFAYALKLQSYGDHSGLQRIAINHPDLLPELFLILRKSYRALNHLADALIMQNEAKQSGLHTLVEKKPDILPMIFKMMEGNVSRQSKLLHALNLADYTGKTGMDFISLHAKNHHTLVIAFQDKYSGPLVSVKRIGMFAESKGDLSPQPIVNEHIVSDFRLFMLAG